MVANRPTMRKLAAGVVLVLLAQPVVPFAAAAEVDKSDNVRLVRSFSYPPSERPIFERGGTDMAFQGRHLYAAEQGLDGRGGGIHIFDVGGRKPRKVSFLPCGGWQNDVAVVKPGLIAIGYHDGKLNCGNPGGGVTLIDVSRPQKPRLLGTTPGDVPPGEDPLGGGGIHTLTVYPGTSFIYGSPGGRQAGYETGIETIVDVSDPRQPKVVATFDSGIGCHDITFDIRADRKLAFCVGIGETQIWDVSDPLSPEVIGHIVNPIHSFQHSAAVTPDGAYVVIGTETLANDCMGGPTGGLFIYDIAEPRAPILAGYFGAQRGATRVYNFVTDPGFDQLCAPHLFNFIPGTRLLVSGNGSGGMNVVDFADPASPEEVAHYMSDTTDYWAAYWYDGRIYANGVRALDVLEVTGVPGSNPNPTVPSSSG